MSPAALRRFVVALAACLALLANVLVGTVGAGSASATTVPWAKMTTAQREVALASAMLALLNTERTANHLSRLSGSPTLIKSALAHNLVMAKDNLMSHQCPGEASPGTRITRAGYKWRAWGENIGWDSEVTITGIQNMEKLMYGERAPDNGHRLNILGHYTAVGVSVYIDSVHHKMWYTQDFAAPA